MATHTHSEPARILVVASSDLDRERELLGEAVDAVGIESGAEFGRIAVVAQHAYDSDNDLPAPSDFDLVIFVLRGTWGPHSGRYASGFKRIFAATRTAAIDRLVYFHVLEDSLLVNPGDEASKIISYRDELEKEGCESIAWYDCPHRFQSLVTEDLRYWLNSGGTRPPRLQTLPDHQRRLSGWSDALNKIPNGSNRLAFRTARRAFAYASAGRFTKACQQFARAVTQAREPYIVNEYGLFLKANGLLVKAEKVFEDLARMGQLIEDRLVIGSALRHLGDINEKSGRLKIADDFYRRALAIEKDYDRVLKQAGLHEALGMVRLKSGAPGEAIQMFNTALELYTRSGSIEGQALIYFCLTGAHIETGDIEKAMSDGKKALELFRELDEPAMIEKLRELLDRLENMRNQSIG